MYVYESCIFVLGVFDLETSQRFFTLIGASRRNYFSQEKSKVIVM